MGLQLYDSLMGSKKWNKNNASSTVDLHWSGAFSAISASMKFIWSLKPVAQSAQVAQQLYNSTKW